MSTADEMEQATVEKVRIPCLVMSRVVGYISPVNFWNTGKKQEWDERKVYHVPAGDSREQVLTVRQASTQDE